MMISFVEHQLDGVLVVMLKGTFLSTGLEALVRSL